ncbi:hypothetical protein Sjap_003797 [Stephania japonica]|uniref:Uncharacterized protein n=1 Tax=Stephania japonica TaxID=461633 RepID=A0AAP0KRJ5_9MAGN
MGANISQLDGGHHQATENEIEILGEREKQVVIASKLPHNYECIIKEADSTINEVSPEKILDRLHSGVLLNQKRKVGVDPSSSIRPGKEKIGDYL